MQSSKCMKNEDDGLAELVPLPQSADPAGGPNRWPWLDAESTSRSSSSFKFNHPTTCAIPCGARRPVAPAHPASGRAHSDCVQGPDTRSSADVRRSAPPACRREPRRKQPSRSPVILTGDHQRGPSPLLHASAEGPPGRQQEDPYIAVWTPPLNTWGTADGGVRIACSKPRRSRDQAKRMPCTCEEAAS